MIIKLIGGSLIIASSTVIGYKLSEKYVKRPGELRSMQTALQMLESEIIFSLNPLPDAFNNIAVCFEGGVKKIFMGAAELLNKRTGMTAQEAWTQSIQNSKSDMHFEEADYKILMEFGNSLGSSDRENQIKNIHLACSKLAMEEKKAEKQREKNEKMYKSLGLLAGVLIVLVLL